MPGSAADGDKAIVAESDVADALPGEHGEIRKPHPSHRLLRCALFRSGRGSHHCGGKSCGFRDRGDDGGTNRLDDLLASPQPTGEENRHEHDDDRDRRGDRSDPPAAKQPRCGLTQRLGVVQIVRADRRQRLVDELEVVAQLGAEVLAHASPPSSRRSRSRARSMWVCTVLRDTSSRSATSWWVHW